MNWFEYSDYKKAINAWISFQPRQGFGQLRALANYLGTHSVVMSQVFRGDRDLSAEQAVLISRYVGHNDLERDYFLLLVNRMRAGTKELADVLDRQIEAVLSKAKMLKNRIKHAEFTNEDRAVFYSHWYYSAIRLASSIDRLDSPGLIAERLDLPQDLVSQVLTFLKTHGLVVENRGRLDLGPKVTHLGADSPLINRHHGNWRLQGQKAMELSQPDHLFYSGPMAISQNTAEAIRHELIELISRVTRQAADSPSEQLHCLNLDWFSL